MKKFTSIIILLTLCLIANSAHARKSSNDQPNPSSYQNIQTAVDNHGTSIANFQNDMNLIVKKIQTINGDIGRNYKQNQDQEKLIIDVQNRLQTVEDKISAVTTQLQELQIEGLLSPVSTKRLREYKSYAKGLEYVNAAQYDKAIKSMQSFQAENQKSILKSYAEFWVAESYYMQGDYKMAIKKYQDLVQMNRNSKKLPLAIYRQGLSFYHLKRYDDAKAFFTQVIRKYPQNVEAIQASAALKRIDTLEELKKQQNYESGLIN
ncbi:MAG: tetratricopeptide repeat protein [bacterium]|nr:tetratricopeptide repeat protein [bacterium]